MKQNTVLVKSVLMSIIAAATVMARYVVFFVLIPASSPADQIHAGPGAFDADDQMMRKAYDRLSRMTDLSLFHAEFPRAIRFQHPYGTVLDPEHVPSVFFIGKQVISVLCQRDPQDLSSVLLRYDPDSFPAALPEELRRKRRKEDD